MADEGEEWRAHAEALKVRGNEAFEAGRLEEAELLYTQAIEVNPDDHVYYSNRSAVYMKSGSVSKALKDAEKCVQLSPSWPKGYNRLGVAQQGLRRFDAAIDSFKRGLELDASNKALLEALRLCEEAREVDKKQRFAEAAVERAREEARLKEADEAKQRAAVQKEEESDLLSSFFGEVAADQKPVPTAPPSEDDLLSSFLTEVKAAPASASSSSTAGGAPSASQQPEQETSIDPQSLATEKYTNQELGDGKTQHARLTAKNCEWRNLNPYYVLQLDIDATSEDIKNRYRKLSTRVHPDKNRDIENARESFEYVKAAYQKLMDLDARRVVVMNIEYVREEVAAERRKLLAKSNGGERLPPLEEHVDKETMKHFASIEVNRRRSEKVQRSHNAREKMQEHEEQEKARRANTFEKDWAQEDRREKRVGNWREFSDDPDAKRVRAASYKTEKRQETKHGNSVVEEWRQNWK